MPISLNRPEEHGFDQPLGLLSDCHRRIERFLEILLTVAEREEERAGLSSAGREALATALRYFREAAPKHTADEEESLFPRMRQSGSAEVREALERLDRLEADHVRAGELHERADATIERWLQRGSLEEVEARELVPLLGELRGLYQEHIELEDTVVFPLAGRTLDDASLAAVGREMAARRGLAARAER